MQELLGRLAALDPGARNSLRVIACFDELVIGNVPPRALLATAAALSGAVVGAAFGGRVERVDRRGDEVTTHPGIHRRCQYEREGLRVWIEGEDPAAADDALVLERLALALRVRVEPPHRAVRRRDLPLLLDGFSVEADRAAAAARLLLAPDGCYRIVAAPLFALWERHPQGPEDVLTTAGGPVHVAVLAEGVPDPVGAPVGVGLPVAVTELSSSLRTALIAVRLHDGVSRVPVRAEDLGGLAVVLAEQFERGTPGPDHDAVARIVAHAWGEKTLDALVRTTSLREAARVLGIHPSTLSARLQTVIAVLGFDPVTGLGRTRLGIAFLLWRLRASRVLDLPVR